MIFDYKGESQAIRVTGGGEWSLQVLQGAEWITVPITSGKGRGEDKDLLIQIQVAANPGDMRQGKIQVRAEGVEQQVLITQRGSGGIVFSKPVITGFLEKGIKIEDIEIQVPFKNAVGNEQFTMSLTTSGIGGVDDVLNFPVSISGVSGTIDIPLSGLPVQTGEVVFRIDATYPGFSQLTVRSTVIVQATVMNSAIIITGVMPDPRGTDAPATGASGTFPNPYMGGASLHAGPYEYMQFMALEDIDFSITPYSVVVAKNTTATGAVEGGWAAGGDKTYKFNLTRGIAPKGSFFYVGGTAFSLNGYNTCGIVDIGHANWIRTIAYNNPGISFDGFGKQTSGLFPNISATLSFTGIGVFRGTAVTEGSVPVDAIFFGLSITSAYNADYEWGYRVPNNERYNRVNPDTGEPQPYFGQGTNTYIFYGPTGTDIAAYGMLGGKLNSKKQWLSPRFMTVKVMTPCQDISYSLLDIEEVPGVTQYMTN